MKYLISIYLLIASALSFGQKIHFTDEGAWYIEGRNDTGAFIQENNYIINYHEYHDGHSYSHFTNSIFVAGVGSPGYEFSIREDTDAGIVYYRDNDAILGVGSVERILYKYHVQVGDTIQSSNSYYPLTVIDSVVNVDSTLIAGNYYKVITMKKIVDPYSSNFGSDSVHTYIEGMGGISGEFSNIINLVYKIRTVVKCFFPDAVYLPEINMLYPYPGINDTTRFKTDCSYISVPEVFASTTTVTITPNPVWDEATISYPASIATGQLQVYDAMGRVVYQAALSGGHSNTLPMGTARPGLYFYRLSDASRGRVYNGRFVKE